ncbi:MAG: hypothetical protein ACK5ZG_06025 [Phycisphaerae bacterium]|jgi:hypothetical protein
MISPRLRPSRASARLRTHACMLLASCLLLTGCATPVSPKPIFDPASTPPANRAALPNAADVIAAYNRRVADVSRLRTPISAVLDIPTLDEQGRVTDQRTKDQLDGNLQLIQPDRVSLRMDKVQQTVFYMGSGSGAYWFIAMGNQPVAYKGEMTQATLAKARSLGLPIHPLDLLDLMAITPLPSNAKLSWWGPYVRVVAAARWGTRELLLDATTLEPAAVWLRDRTGKIAVWAETTNYKDVPVTGKGISPARVPGRVRAVVPGATPQGDSFIELFITKPENPGLRIREKQFQFDAVLNASGASEVIDIDASSAGSSKP